MTGVQTCALPISVDAILDTFVQSADERIAALTVALASGEASTEIGNREANQWSA